MSRRTSGDLSDLTRPAVVREEEIVEVKEKPTEKARNAIFGHGFLGFFIVFIIIALITYGILFLLKIDAVQRKDATGLPTGEIDQSKAIIWSIVIALIIVVLIYLLRPREY